MIHPRFSLRIFLVVFGLIGWINQPAVAEEIRVAVASNFTGTVREIASAFEKQSEHTVTLVFGSTGRLYAQIQNGAPFDAFLAADAERPKLLEKNGSAVADSRFTYAVGKLVLWSPKLDLTTTSNVLATGSFLHIAIANPKLAPYGAAAREVLEHLALWTKLESRIVRGQDIGQTYQFVNSGNAELGFVALAQIQRPGQRIVGSIWEIPQKLYTPIEQQAVLLKDRPAPRAFLEFLRSDAALKIIEAHGYAAPSCSATPTSTPSSSR